MRHLPIVIIGNGGVGRAFVGQLLAAQPALRRRGVEVRVAGMVRRAAALFVSTGIPEDTLADLAAGRAAMTRRGERQEQDGGWDEVTKNIADMGLAGTVVVDLTAEGNAAAHAEWLRRGWHVITANKRPLTAPLLHYDAIMNAVSHPGSPSYRYEATVGAGLPVVSALLDMQHSGDTVLEVGGAVSGTLGAIFSACEDGVRFAAAVADAKASGFTEPDPREDLSGADVARKALILARLLGMRKDMDDVAVESLVPPALASVPNAEFMDALTASRLDIDKRFRTAARRGKTLRYLLTIEKENVRAGIEEVPKDSPFGTLKGPENMFVIRSTRYGASPLIIRGPGAGPEVTAAGVFSDLLRIICL